MTSVTTDELARPFAGHGSSDRDIRLVKLYPGLFEDHIRCSLETTSLDSKPTYEALSYVWGDPTLTTQILVDDCPLEMTINLAVALRQIRQSSKTRVLWIDAICIDQADSTEKTHQVKLMGNIYRASQHCLVWLGTLEASGLGQTQAEAAAELWGFFASDKRLSETTIFRIGKIMTSPWWSRIWTVQEAVLPPAAILIWGNVSISWDSLGKARSSMMNHSYECCGDEWATLPWGPGDFHSLFLFTKTISWMETSREAALAEPASPYATFWIPCATLWNFRERYATDPKDKMLGLLELFPRWSEHSAKANYYDMDKVQLYHHMTRGLIQMDNSLSMLIGSDRKHSDRPAKLASWAIDWKTWNCLGIYYYWSRLQRYAYYSADKDTEVFLQPLLDPSIIGLVGVFVDKIIAVGRLPTRDTNNNLCDEDEEDELELKLTDLKKWQETGRLGGDVTHQDRLASMREWTQLSKKRGLLDKNYIAGGPWKQAFWRTLIGNLMTKEGETPDRTASPDDEERFDAYVNGNFDYEMPFKFQHSMDDMVEARLFFITQQGYMGVGPREMEVNDEVWVLFGSRIPFALRKLGTGQIRNIFLLVSAMCTES